MFTLSRVREDGKNAAAENYHIEQSLREIGDDLWKRMSGERPGVFNKQFWLGQILDRTMSDASFKVDMFRLIDALPALSTSKEVSLHLREYLLHGERELPAFMKAALKAASGGFGSGLAVRTFKKHVAEMAGQFIAGEDGVSALPAIRSLRKQGLGFTADLLGEATVSEAEADHYANRYLELIRSLAEEVEGWEEDAVLDHDGIHPVPRANVSVKLSALAPHLNPVDKEGAIERLFTRVTPILRAAKEAGVFVNFDLEQWSMHGITYALFDRVALMDEFRDWPHLGIVVQAYLKSAEGDLEGVYRLAEERGTPLTVRLVKGAYWDHEVVRSEQHGYPCPVWMDKAATDANYEKLSTKLLHGHRMLRPAFGTHNLRSMAYAIAQARALDVPKEAVEFQSLYGMAEPERKALRELGYRVRVYMPLGEMLPGMAYLVRRLLENTANSGFLRLTYHDDANLDVLFAKPEPATVVASVNIGTSPDTPFANCPLLDFTDDEVRGRFAKAVSDCEQTFPIDVPVVIDGTVRSQGRTLDRVCPSETERIVSRVHLAMLEDAKGAVDAAANAWPAWRDRPLEERSALLEELAGIIERDRFELAALQCYESAKPWMEADGDVAEAIDFCRYYARQALLELGDKKQGNAPGEINTLFYEGRGPTVVIAPWNFPLAILCGMSTAALVAGNPIIMKPAEQSSATAYRLYERMIEAGFPPEVVQFVPGMGEEVGPALVEHAKVAQIAFTGGKAVGLDIVKRAAIVQPGQPSLKRVVCEMGGKNAIIVDSDADLDEAVKGVTASAFGFAGQKCSACSRVIVVGDVYDRFTKRLVEAAKSLALRPAHEPACDVPPVVDEEAYERLKSLVANPGEGAELLYAGENRPGGYFIAPAVFRVSDPMHRLMQEEFFGPIVALYRVEDFDEALRVANDTEFALTGGVYSRLPSHLELARRRFRVGNLYLNRATTGAMVGRQPFGGFDMSGGGTKAGGAGYLLHFADPRTVTESTLRSGFTPDVNM